MLYCSTIYHLALDWTLYVSDRPNLSNHHYHYNVIILQIVCCIHTCLLQIDPCTVYFFIFSSIPVYNVYILFHIKEEISVITAALLDWSKRWFEIETWFASRRRVRRDKSTAWIQYRRKDYREITCIRTIFSSEETPCKKKRASENLPVTPWFSETPCSSYLTHLCTLMGFHSLTVWSLFSITNFCC